MTIARDGRAYPNPFATATVATLRGLALRRGNRALSNPDDVRVAPELGQEKGLGAPPRNAAQGKPLNRACPKSRGLF